MPNFSLPESSKNFYIRVLILTKGVNKFFMNNISFNGRTTLILNPKAYDEARTITSSTYRHLKSRNHCNLSNGKIYTSKADAQNLAVIIRNEKDGVIKHIPVNGKIQVFVDEISQKIEELKKMSRGKLTAWIIGGENIKSQNGGKTIETVNKLADVICDRPDIDTSILAGSINGEDKIVVHTKNNKLELILDKEILPGAQKDATSSDLEKYFDIVELNNTELSYTK